MLNAAFGSGPKQSGDTQIQGRIDQSGLSGNYATWWHQDNGWFRGNSSGTDYSPIGSAESGAIKKLVTSVESVFDGLIAAAG